MDESKNRLKALERQVRRMRVAVVGMMVAIVAAVAMGAASITDTLRANKIVFTDALTFETADGQKVAELKVTSTGPQLYMYNNAARRVVALGAMNADFGGGLTVEGQTAEKQSVQVSGRGINIMGRPVSGGIGPWMSLCHQKDMFSGLEIRGQGVEMIKLDNRDGAARIEIIDADGKESSLVP